MVSRGFGFATSRVTPDCPAIVAAGAGVRARINSSAHRHHQGIANPMGRPVTDAVARLFN
ncbi:hypothetical protein [Thioalkalivibrio thiocyanodenitrificans]|uniref:hypothetical protein n=1 Tax=Thioalkalivibrio thiocyanodenitrificans TaxID=243063 RepID=UPI0003A263F5|nr:hypothetical protein [Thioalkalivibrio thiocyanodenitrificans]